MSGYRCVNFTDLCRLCSSAGTNNIQIFNDESLQKKITECLSITLNEKDKLPKVICASCLDYVQVFSDFRQACSNAQKMLESCLNTSKLRNGGQVYIKDEVPTKKVLKPIQSPSTKLLPNLCNIVTSPQAKKNVLTSPNQPDFLSSIMQAVGIQTNDEALDNNVSFTQNLQSSQSMPSVPQYTLTLDGGTLKSGQIQYKIENAGNINMTSQAQILAKNVQDSQNQQSNTISMDEFIKLKKNPTVLKTNPVIKDEPKNKKPKFNLILQASPQKQKFGSQVSVAQPQKTFGTQSTPPKSQIQIHNIEKIIPANNQVSPSKQLVLPIMVRNDGTRNADAAQLISQALNMSNNQSNMENKGQANPPFAYVQMKIQPNADGQLTLTPASTVPPPQQLQLSLSPQQLQQLSFQAPPQQQAPPLSIQPQITVTQIPAQEQTDSQTQTPSQISLKSEVEVEEESFEHHEEDYFFMENDNDESANESQGKDSPEVKPTITIIKKKPLKPAKKVKAEDLTDLQSVQQEHSDMANKQLKQLTSFNTKRSESESAEKPPDLNLTICDVCKKVFKRKEFLMQHLKSHIGLRPFKCSEPTCNKSFSRKEHLLRHVVSHTGKKMFSCDVCKKLFSRKDNLNKHRRIHPDPSQTNGKHSCQTCSKSFAQRAQLSKHQSNCGGKSDGSTAVDENIKEDKKDKDLTVKKVKQKPPKKDSEPTPKTTEAQQQPVAVSQHQQQIVTILQQQQPQQQQPQIKLKNEPQQQQIILSMSQAQAMFQAQQQKNAVYTFPTNLILNSNGAFMTNSGEVVGNFKFDNQ